MKTQALSVAGIVTIPVADSFSIGVRGGAAYSRLEAETDVVFRFNGVTDPNEHTSDSESEFGAVYGISVEYAATRRVAVRAERQKFTDIGKGFDSFDGFDIEVLTLSVLGRF